ncbi:MAG: DUF975 family protein [Ruminococcaceae bacterium]|nr:DUF975 family protein [Oscillospiraceae bacterium]
MFAKDFRNVAWNALSGKWGRFALVTLVYELILGACAPVSNIATLVIGGPFLLGMAGIAFNVLDDVNFDVNNLFDGFKRFSDALVLYVVNNLFIFLWSLLFIIPGIIKYYEYSMSYYILLENPDMKHREARLASMKLMEGNKGRLFCLHLSFIGWFILSAFTFGILLLWVVPYMETAQAAFYREICREKTGKISAQASVEC